MKPWERHATGFDLTGGWHHTQADALAVYESRFRDECAMAALPWALSVTETEGTESDHAEASAMRAYVVADAMLAERKLRAKK